ncbi:MAG: hypothetical protein ACM3UN_03330 [Bacillota bacterium]
MDISDEKADRLIELLEEILKWTRIEGMQRTKSIFEEFVKSDLEKVVYENSNGQTSREVGAIAKTSHTTVVSYWRKWSKLGIVKEVVSKGGTRYKRIFSLDDFGISVPKIDSKPVDIQELEGGNKSE